MSDGQENSADSPGVRLARARERLGLSLDEVGEKLRLEPQIVAALEADDHRAVGAAVFVRGFLRRYADLVKESHDEIDALYLKMPEAGAAPDLTSTGLRRLESSGPHARLGVTQALIAVAVLGVVAAVWWGTRTGSAPAPEPAPPEAEVVHIDAAGAATGDSARAAPGVTPRALDNAVETPAGTAHDAAGAVVSGSAAPNPVLPGTVLSGTGVPAAGPSGAAAADAGALPLHRRHLQVTFNGECWAEIYDARGMRLFFGFGHAGSTQALSGVAPFRLVLGNVDAVAVAVEGTPVALPSAQPGARLRVSLNGNGAIASVR